MKQIHVLFSFCLFTLGLLLGSQNVFAGKHSYTCGEFEPACVQNYNTKTYKSNGKKSLLVQTFNFNNTSWYPSRSAVRRTMNKLTRFFRGASRGALDITSIEVRDTLGVPFRQSCRNRGKAKRRVVGARRYSYKVMAFPRGTCNFANASGTTVNINSGYIFNRMTLSHEFGHVFRLTHSRDAVRHCPRKRKDGLCADKSTYMGYSTPYNRNYNVVDLHWMGWLKKHEVERILPGKTEYQLRAINRNIKDGDAPLALVFDLPQSGDRMYLSIPRSAKRLKKRGKRLSSLQFAVYIASKCQYCAMQKSVLVKRFNRRYVDETGLKIEVTRVKNRSEATLSITYEPAMAACALPPKVSVSQRLVAAKTDTQAGQVEMNVEVTNPNAKSCRPFYLYGGISVATLDAAGSRRLGKQDGITQSPINTSRDSRIWPDAALNHRKRYSHPLLKRTLIVTSDQQVNDARVQMHVGDLPVIDEPISFIN